MTAPVDSHATIVCAHGGRATTTAPGPRVALGGAGVLTVGTPMAIAGCALPPAAGGPCVEGMWLTGTRRVTASGRSLVLAGSRSVCVPTGTPLTVVATQGRVSAL